MTINLKANDLITIPSVIRAFGKTCKNLVLKIDPKLHHRCGSIGCDCTEKEKQKYYSDFEAIIKEVNQLKALQTIEIENFVLGSLYIMPPTIYSGLNALREQGKTVYVQSIALENS